MTAENESHLNITYLFTYIDIYFLTSLLITLNFIPFYLGVSRDGTINFWIKVSALRDTIDRTVAQRNCSTFTCKQKYIFIFNISFSSTHFFRCFLMLGCLAPVNNCNKVWEFIKLPEIWVYLGVRTCEVFLCFVAIVRVRVYYADFFVFFVLRHWWVL